MKLILWPSKQQWRTWTLPNKLTAVGVLVGTPIGVLGLLMTVMQFFLAPQSSMISNPSSSNGQIANSILNVNTALPHQALSFLHQLPEPPKDFVGREKEIAESIKALENKGQGVIISGMAGVGAEELARVIANQVKDRFTDGQVFMQLCDASDEVSKEPATPAEVLQHVVRSFLPEAQLSEDVDWLKGQYRSLLDKKRVLILIENAVSSQELAPLMPLPSGCAIIVTSQQHFALSGIDTIVLNPLAPEEARLLLLKICPRIGGHANSLAERCGHLPLALRLAASALNSRPTLDVLNYLNDLSNERTRLTALDAYKNYTDDARGIEASLGLNYRLLDNSLQRYWRELSVFSGFFDVTAAESVWHLEEEKEAARILGELYAVSLIQWNETTHRYCLNDLVRTYASARLTEKERFQDSQRHALYYAKVLRRTTALYLQGGDSMRQGLSLFDLEWSNICAGHAWAAAHWKNDETAASLCKEYPNAGTFCLALRLRSCVWIAWLEAAVEAARSLGDRPAERTHLGNLAFAYKQLSESGKAIEYFNQALVISREIRDSRGEATCLGGLGGAYASLGELRTAITFYERQYAIAQRIAYRDGEGVALCNLGLAYLDLGNAQKTLEFCKRALLIFQEIGDRHSEGATLGNLGNAFARLNDPRKALGYHTRQLEISRELGDRQGEASALGYLGMDHYLLGEPQEAILYQKQRLSIARDIGDRKGEASALDNLGLASVNCGEINQAIKFHEQALVISRQIGSKQGEACSLGNLGLASAALGNRKAAIDFFKKGLAVDRIIGNQLGEGIALLNLAKECEESGLQQEAIDHAAHAVEIFDQIKSPDAAKARARLKELRK